MFSTVRAVDSELKEFATGLRQKEEKRIRAMGKALTAKERDDWEDEGNAVIASTVREEVEDILNLLAFWYRDLLLIKEGVSADLVVNLDVIEALRKSAAQMTTGEIVSRLGAVEKTRRAVALMLPLASCMEALYTSGG